MTDATIKLSLSSAFSSIVLLFPKYAWLKGGETRCAMNTVSLSPNLGRSCEEHWPDGAQSGRVDFISATCSPPLSLSPPPPHLHMLVALSTTRSLLLL